MNIIRLLSVGDGRREKMCSSKTSAQKVFERENETVQSLAWECSMEENLASDHFKAGESLSTSS